MKNLYAFVIFVGVAASVVRCDDASSDVIRPCDIKDIQCIGDYLSKGGDCKKLSEQKTHFDFQDNLPIFLPSINLTVVTSKKAKSYIVGNFEEFFVKDNKLVMSVNFVDNGDIFCEAPDTYFAISQNEKEPIAFQEYVNASYPGIITIIADVTDGFTAKSLKEAKYTAYFPNSNAAIFIGPKFTQSENPLVSASYAGLLADISTALLEIFETKASYFGAAFLQGICDFGINPVLFNYDNSIIESVSEKDVNDESNFSEICSEGDAKLDCARSFFKKHGSCDVITESKDGPIKRMTYYTDRLPFINATVGIANGEISELDGQIESFYIDEATGNLVMSVKFEKLTLSTDTMTVINHQKGQLPKTITDSITGYFPITLTLVTSADKITSETLPKAWSSAYLSQPPSLEFGSKLSQSEDPEIMKKVQAAANNPTTIGLELFQNEALKCIIDYIQKDICDFGIKM